LNGEGQDPFEKRTYCEHRTKVVQVLIVSRIPEILAVRLSR
jgi:hypothetical protein